MIVCYTASQIAQCKISTVNIRALQSPHDDVLRNIRRHIIVCCPTAHAETNFSS